MKNFLYTFFLFILINETDLIHAQSRDRKNLVYVDKQGVLRWTKENTEASFFGINYTVPFAYGYRSLQKLEIDHQKAIDQDVYHFARLGLDAFRVHVWDTEITDSLGNLLENEHLRLYDYLLFKLKERNIKTILTPLAYWGNGYPERDVKTGSFSSNNNKQQVLVNENAIRAQENYIKQILKHVNPYTKVTYGNDPDIIAFEINNEPHHSGPKQKVTEYINRMVAATKSSGWNKPIFYNISESPSYADAVSKANIDGVSFQWYPTGLVANHSLKGNYLPHVDYYRIPFGDTIPQYAGKARMVYEFDAGDVLQSYMYPAMARSFRKAGIQWATQFAYDPMATAYANTEYQTHYLNLAYTPSKAISLLIASKVFHTIPRLKDYGHYPADSVFDVFRVSYKNSLSEMNSEEEFYYSNSTSTNPRNILKLKHIAGVGSSPIVQYEGTGAYFLDKIGDGRWRLEVMPDAIHIRDPFAKASPKKEVTRIQWQSNSMRIDLPGFSEQFVIAGTNNSNTAHKKEFQIRPGTYILNDNKPGKETPGDSRYGVLGMTEFYAPSSSSEEPFVIHEPYFEISAGKPYSLSVKITGVDSSDRITAEVRNSSNKWKTVSFQKKSSVDYDAEIPTDMITPGVLNYRIMIQKSNNEYFTFPGSITGNPYAWDYYLNESWQTFVASERGTIELFNAGGDRNNLVLYNPDWRNNVIEYVTSVKPGQLVLKMTANKLNKGQLLGFQYYFGDRIKGRSSEVSSFEDLIVWARTGNVDTLTMKVALILKDGSSYAAFFTVRDVLEEIRIPLNRMIADSVLLLPRPYPGFLPLWFKTGNTEKMDLQQAEKIEITFGHKLLDHQYGKAHIVEIESIQLVKK